MIGDEGRFKKLRMWLNIAFMLLAVVGMVLFYTGARSVATYVLIAAIVPKFVEVSIRIIAP
jgi:hypothetical protein